LGRPAKKKPFLGGETRGISLIEQRWKGKNESSFRICRLETSNVEKIEEKRGKDEKIEKA